MIKKTDVIIVTAVLIFAVLSLFFVNYGKAFSKDSEVNIYIDGKMKYSYPLKEKNGRVVKINNKYGYNEIVIENGNVYVKEADCNGKDCLKMGRISSVHGFIICQPHRLMIKIEKKAGDSDVSAITY